MTDPIVLSWSGGKDSARALAALRADSRFDVVALMTSVTREYERVSIHGVRRALLLQQAAALELPLFEVSLAPVSSNDAYEAAFRATLAELRAAHPTLRHLAFGDLFLEDVRAYRERLVEPLGFVAEFPLWGRPTDALAVEMIESGYTAHLVCVDTHQLPGTFAGRTFDRPLLADLPAGVDPCGERGEFHTFVSDGPIFSRPIEVRLGETVLRDDRFVYCDLLPVSEADTASVGQSSVRVISRQS